MLWAFSEETVYHIGVDLIYYMKCLHNLGLLYFDLKDDNIILKTNPLKIGNNPIHFTFEDFRHSVEYLNKDKNNNYVNYFYKFGNYPYSSINQNLKGEVGRKDEFISLCYILFDLCGEFLAWKYLNYNDPKYSEKLVDYKKNLIRLK